jgi:long-chain fatty acid transport protein
MKFYRLFSNHRLAALPAALLCTLFTVNSYAGALYVYETGSPTEIGYAGAGMTARAQDAGTVFTNPAGMTRFEGNAMVASGGMLYLDAPFDPDSGTTISGTDGSTTELIPFGSFAYINSVSDQLKLGFSVQNNFGLALDWGSNWVGRYTATRATIVAPQAQPTVAYKINDWLSVGAGAALTLGYLNTSLKVNNSTLDPGDKDGRMSYKDTDFAVQGNFGIMLTPSKGTRIGLRYLTETDLDFEDDPSFSGIGANTSAITSQIKKLDLGLKMPQSLILGVFHELNDKWAILGSVGWDDYSEFGKVNVSVDDSPEVTDNLDFDDTYHVGVAAQYQSDPRLLYSFGFSYDSSLSDDRHRSLEIPLGEMYRFGVGMEQKKGDDLTLGGAIDIMWEGDLPLDNSSDGGTVSGEYENVSLTFFTLYAKWQ